METRAALRAQSLVKWKFPTVRTVIFLECRITKWNGEYSPHAWGNALDVWGTFKQMQAIANFAIEHNVAYDVHSVLWNGFGYEGPDWEAIPIPKEINGVPVPQHLEHVHIGFLPVMMGTPPGCAAL